MVSARIRWGVAGCGWVARDYVIPGIRAVDNAVFAAAQDPDHAALAPLSDAATYHALDDMLARDDIDAVYIAAPNHLHAPIALACARARKAVLCEKPIAHDLAGARAICAAFTEAGVPFATAYDQRFHAAHRMIRAMIARGDLGLVTQARVHYACWVGPQWAADNWRVDASRSGGGALIDLAPHCVDLLDWLIGAQLDELHVMLQRRAQNYAVDDGAVIAARWSNGALATINVGYNCPETLPRRRLEIIGTQGMACAQDTMGQTPGGSLAFIDAATGDTRMLDLVDDRSPFAVQIEAFSHALLTREPFPFTADRDLALFTILMNAAHAAERRADREIAFASA